MPSAVGSRARRENSGSFDGSRLHEERRNLSPDKAKNRRCIVIGPTRNAARARDQSVPHAKPVKLTHKTRLRPATVSRQSSRLDHMV